MLAHAVLAMHDVPKLGASLLNSKNEHVRLNALMYLTNREQGCLSTLACMPCKSDL